MEVLFTNNYVLAAYGWVIYTILMFVLSKDKYDNESKKFDYYKYLSQNFDNWVLSLLLVPVMAHFAQDIWLGAMDYFEKTWDFRKPYYLLVGALVEIIYWAIAKFRKK